MEKPVPHYSLALIRPGPKTAGRIAGRRDYLAGAGAYSSRRDVLATGHAGPDLGDWRRVDEHERRWDAVVGRAGNFAMPYQLPLAAQIRVMSEHAELWRRTYGVAVCWALHEASARGDRRNRHGHVAITARAVADDGTLGGRVLELDLQHGGRKAILAMRRAWEAAVNRELEAAGLEERLDLRSFKDQDITDRQAGRHRGPRLTAVLRREGPAAAARLQARRAKRPTVRAAWRAARAAAIAKGQARSRRGRGRPARPLPAAPGEPAALALPAPAQAEAAPALEVPVPALPGAAHEEAALGPTLEVTAPPTPILAPAGEFAPSGEQTPAQAAGEPAAPALPAPREAQAQAAAAPGEQMPALAAAAAAPALETPAAALPAAAPEGAAQGPALPAPTPGEPALAPAPAPGAPAPAEIPAPREQAPAPEIPTPESYEERRAREAREWQLEYQAWEEAGSGLFAPAGEPAPDPAPTPDLAHAPAPGAEPAAAVVPEPVNPLLLLLERHPYLRQAKGRNRLVVLIRTATGGTYYARASAVIFAAADGLADFALCTRGGAPPAPEQRQTLRLSSLAAVLPMPAAPAAPTLPAAGRNTVVGVLPRGQPARLAPAVLAPAHPTPRPAAAVPAQPAPRPPRVQTLERPDIA